MAWNPVPGRAEFYVRNFKENVRDSYKAGQERYFESLKTNKTSGAIVGLQSMAIALASTAFQKHPTVLTVGLVSTLMGSPLISAMKLFPKMDRAYELLQQGEPTASKQLFKRSMDESVYQIFNNYAKPISFGFMAASILVFPATFRNILKHGANWHTYHAWDRFRYSPFKAMAWVANKLKITEQARPIQFLDKITSPMVQFGDYVVAKGEAWIKGTWKQLQKGVSGKVGQSGVTKP